MVTQRSATSISVPARRHHQEFTRIGRLDPHRLVFSNRTLTDAVDLAVREGWRYTSWGCCLPAVYSHEEHIHAMVRLAVQRGAPRLRARLSRRPRHAAEERRPLQAMDAVFAELGRGRVATLIGRYFAMDCDHRWDRIQRAYELITQGKAGIARPQRWRRCNRRMRVASRMNSSRPVYRRSGAGGRR